MRVGVGRLLLAIASVVVRMGGAADAADLFAFAFLTSATFNLYRSTDLRSTVRTLRS